MNTQLVQVSQEQVQVEAIRALTKEIALNDFGMPTGVYRTDLLPYHDYVPQYGIKHNGTNGNGISGNAGSVLLLDGIDPIVRDDESRDLLPAVEVYRVAGFPASTLAQAFMPLQYDEGFPAFDGGMPFWGRLDFEPYDAFEAFQKYLQMQAGRVEKDIDEDYDGDAASGSRSVSDLAMSLHPDGKALEMVNMYQAYYHLYYWGMRAHAYDLCRLAQYKRQQELRAVETQDEHYVQTRRLRHRLMGYMDNEEEFWDLMTPKVAIDMFKTLTSLERISAGVPAGGPISEEDQKSRGAPFEVVLKTVAQTNRRSDEHTINEEGEILDRALESPEATEVLQELIIRQGGG